MKKMCIKIFAMVFSFILGICSNINVITEENPCDMKVESKIETSMVFVSFDE